MKLLYAHNADFSVMSANKIQVAAMCKAFAESGIETRLLGFGDKKIKEKYDIGKAIPILKKSIKNYYFRTLILFREFLKIKEEYDIIYTRDLLFAWLAARFSNRKVIYEVHEIIDKRTWKWLIKNSKKIYLIVAISKGLKKELVKLGVKSKKIMVLPDGVEIEKFSRNISMRNAREKLKLPLNKKIILYTGSLIEWKGWRTFAEASKFSNKLLFLIVGGKKENKSTKSHKNIRFIKFQPQNRLVLYLKSADILVIPNSKKYKISRTYTSPLKLFEYIASKRPVIASDLPSIREIVSKKEALFFKPDNPKDLAGKIEMLLKDKKLQKDIVRNAFRKVKKYSWKRRAEKIKNEI